MKVIPLKNATLFLVLMHLAGCSSCKPKSDEITWSDGKLAIALQCRGSMVKCYKAASEACPYGYSVVDKEVTGIGSEGMGFSKNGIGGGTSSSHTDKDFIIRCKDDASGTSDKN